MIVFPAIDILNGCAVRLLKGDYGKVTDYGDPVERALKWKAEGAEFLHIVDLDGAKTGLEKNGGVISEIVKTAKLPVQTGGGIRTLKDMEKMLSSVGVKRVILGTVCAADPELVAAAVKNFGQECIVAGIDVKDGFVAVKGWLESSGLTPVDLGKKMFDLGVKYVVYTDISRDGALSGVNVDACASFQNKTGLRCIASGGVSSLEDIVALKSKNIYGAILGKAIFENRFKISEAVELIKTAALTTGG